MTPEKLKDIQVWGTMLEGRVQPAPGVPGTRKAPAKSASVSATGPVAASDVTLARDVPVRLAELLEHKHGH